MQLASLSVLTERRARQGVTVSCAGRPNGSAIFGAQGEFTPKPVDPRYEYQLVVAEKAFDQDEGVSARSGGEPVRIVLRRRGVFRGRVWGEDQPLKNFCVDGNEVTSADGRIDFGAAGIKTIAERFIKTKP